MLFYFQYGWSRRAAGHSFEVFHAERVGGGVHFAALSFLMLSMPRETTLRLLQY